MKDDNCIGQALSHDVCYVTHLRFYGHFQVGGLLTKSLVRFLLPLQKHSGSTMMSDFSSQKSLNLPLLIGQESEADIGGTNIPQVPSLRMLLTTPTNTVHHYWRKFDDAVMRPAFGGRGFVRYAPGSPPELVVQ